MKLETEKLEEIKTNIYGTEILDPEKLDKLKELKEESPYDYVTYAKLTIECYNIIKENLNTLFNDDEYYQTEFKKIGIIDLKNALSDYDSGNNVGDYWIKLKIEKAVIKNLENYDSIIMIVFKLFGDDV